MTAAEALANPDLVNRVAGHAPASPTTVRKVLRGERPRHVKRTFAGIARELAREGVELAPDESVGGPPKHLQVMP